MTGNAITRRSSVKYQKVYVNVALVPKQMLVLIIQFQGSATMWAMAHLINDVVLVMMQLINDVVRVTMHVIMAIV
jgi:hypothetical protein